MTRLSRADNRSGPEILTPPKWDLPWVFVVIVPGILVLLIQAVTIYRNFGVEERPGWDSTVSHYLVQQAFRKVRPVLSVDKIVIIGIENSDVRKEHDHFTLAASPRVKETLERIINCRALFVDFLLKTESGGRAIEGENLASSTGLLEALARFGTNRLFVPSVDRGIQRSGLLSEVTNLATIVSVDFAVDSNGKVLLLPDSAKAGSVPACVAMSGRSATATDYERLWLNYKGMFKPEFHYYSLEQAATLAARDPRAFEDRIVLLGDHTTFGMRDGTADLHRSVFGNRWHGVDLVALALENSLPGFHRPIREWIYFESLLASLVYFAAIALVMLPVSQIWSKPWVAAVAGGFSILGAFTFSLGLQYAAGRLVPWIFPTCLPVLGAAVIHLLRAWQGHNSKLTMPRVFISHSSTAEPKIVHTLVHELRKRRIDAHYDGDGLEVGENWKPSVADMISYGDWFILLLDETAAQKIITPDGIGRSLVGELLYVLPSIRAGRKRFCFVSIADAKIDPNGLKKAAFSTRASNDKVLKDLLNGFPLKVANAEPAVIAKEIAGELAKKGAFYSPRLNEQREVQPERG